MMKVSADSLPCLCILLVSVIAKGVEAIGCFRCSSNSGSNPECEDTFNATSKIYESDCMAGRKGRAGLFPGTSCIKLSAQHEETGETVVIRDCVVDNGGITSDTEISRTTHCGWVDRIQYQNKDMRGCVLTCYQDGCNKGVAHAQPLTWTVMATGLAACTTWLL